MGYQESFVQFENLEVMKEELRKYRERDVSNYQVRVFGLAQVTSNAQPFKKGDIAVVVGGERWAQRNIEEFSEETGISHVVDIVFIDNSKYYTWSKGNLTAFLDSHFRYLNNDEVEEFIAD